MEIPKQFSPVNISSEIQKIKNSLDHSSQNLRLLFSLIDLTSLNTDDTGDKISNMCRKVNEFQGFFPDVPNVGAICVYPSLVGVVKETLNVPRVSIASVAGGFPNSQTYLEVKLLESRLAVNKGANEIDIVIPVGKFLSGDISYVQEEIREIRSVIGDARLKVILETGLLPVFNDIYRASTASLEAGADFIKTSTGKVQPAASLEAVYIMCRAIHAHYIKTGHRAGIKPAGGISTTQQAMEYASVVYSQLGEEWLNPGLFRIGASRLANNLLSEIKQLETGETTDIGYF